MQTARILALAALALVVHGGAALAAKPPINTRGPGGVFSKGEQWQYALDGYDTVAYFTEGKPVVGSDRFVSELQGVKFRFASAENKARFDADPDRYRPQYGGYCAYAVSQGGAASGDPLVWDIHDGKLYLNLNLGIQKRWRQDRDGYIAKADANWPGVLE